MGSIFDILGPVMVGPSSSHTAGAARIGYTARQLFDEPVKKAEVYLHGSFAATGKGHGTDRAIIAGLLGMKPDDLRIPVAFEEAKKAGMEFTIANRELKNAHPNTARVVMENAEGRKMVLQAYSIGGGRIRVSILDGIEVDFSGESNTLIVRNMDRPGCITEVSAALSREKINVATMQVFRHKRGGGAVMVVETDERIPISVTEELRKKEERKDRLHQNYLRRKANGKQKEWEKRYNAKRKAQVEAAKATIRAEDMEKGIFTTVSQLPRQEPRKATVSASATV